MNKPVRRFTYAICTDPGHTAREKRHVPIVDQPTCTCGYTPRDLWELIIDEGDSSLIAYTRYKHSGLQRANQVFSLSEEGTLGLRELHDMLHAFFATIDNVKE